MKGTEVRIPSIGKGTIAKGKPIGAPKAEAFARGERTRNLICGFNPYRNRWVCKFTDDKKEFMIEQVQIKETVAKGGDLRMLFRNPKLKDVQIIGVQKCKIDYGNLICELSI